MILLSVIPGVILFFIVWKYDTVEKESPGLLLKLFIGGVLTIISTQLIGMLGEKLLKISFKDTGSLLYIMIFTFVLVAFLEEIGKFFVMKMLTWVNDEFNYTFDGVVYAVTVSLGFAIVENIIYVIIHGAASSIVRVILSVPGHLIYAVFMGYFYGRARYAKGEGNKKEERLHLAEALFIPSVMHGFYSLCMNTDKKAFLIIFVIYEIVITVVTVMQFLKFSKNDTLIPGMEYTVCSDNGKEGAHEGKM